MAHKPNPPLQPVAPARAMAVASAPVDGAVVLTVDKSKDPETHGEELVFAEFLRNRGLKFTPARRQLLRAIFGIHDHFTADQLLDMLKAQGVAASKATVYRTLGVMLTCDLLEMHDFGEGAHYYEHAFGHAHHDHLFCVACKRITEFRDDRIEVLQREVTARLGFTLLSHTLKIYGMCASCQQQAGKPPAAELARAAHRG